MDRSNDGSRGPYLETKDMTDFTQRIEQLSENKRLQLARSLHLLQDKGPHRQLVAFIVAEKHIDEISLQDYLADYLPDYMLPKQYVELEEIPFTANGKIDRNSLVMPVHIGKHTDMDAMESALALIWGEVLGMDVIQIDDDYFELGGDSITSIQIIARASKLGIYFSPSNLMEHPSIRQLAKVVTHNQDLSTVQPETDLESNSEDEDEDEDKDEMLRILDLD